MAKRGFKLQEFVAHASDVNCVHIGKKSRRVFVSGGGDCKVNLWAIGKPTSLLSLSGHTSSVQSVILDSAEVLVLAGSSNGPIKLWDLEEAKIVRTLSGHRSNCTAVEFHPFGEFFASGSLDTDLKIWDIRKKGCIHTYKGHTRGIRSIKFTPDGRWVVTGGEDNTVKLWDLTAGKLLHDFKFHNGSVRCIDFHPHEFLLATGSADRTVKFWDLETFELIGSAGPEATGVRSMVFHQDGKVLFCGLDEILKVFSWEPIRCHDIVEMGWSTLGDLSIYEEKLLGCSYYRNRVGVWVADISLIGPFAAGIVPMTNALMEPLYSCGDYHSLEIARDSTVSSKTLVAGPLDCVSETKEAQKSSCMASLQEVNQAWNTTPTNPTEFRKSNTTLSRQSAPAKFGSRISRNHSLNSLTFKFDKATESRLPTTNRTESSFAARDVSLRSTTVSADSLLSCKKGLMVKENALNNNQSLSRSFSVPNIVPGDHPRLEANEENVSSREQTRSSSRNVAERFERIMLVEQPDGLDNCKLEESPCSSTETNLVKYVKGVAVQLGKTRSLVESWERRERCDSNYRNTSSSSSDQVDISVSFSSMQKGQVQSSEMGVTAADDFVSPGSLLQNHDVFINVVKSRLTKLQVVKHFWEQNGIDGAINAVGKLLDQAVQIDVFSILREKIDLFTLDLFSSSLPMLVGLLNSKTERHVTISVEILLELVKIFAPVIVSTRSASSSLGVDLQREKRLECCNQCFNHLRKIKLVLPSLLGRGGLQAEHARELALILHDMSPN